MTSANKVASHFLVMQDEENADITNMKLQKLLYYAQGLYLALHDRPLFSEKIVAWTHGPVVPEVYHKYKVHEGNPIPRPKRASDPVLSDNKQAFLEEVYKVYGQFSAWKLRNMSHAEAPYIRAKGGEISHSSMKKYFSDYVKT